MSQALRGLLDYLSEHQIKYKNENGNISIVCHKCVTGDKETMTKKFSVPSGNFECSECGDSGYWNDFTEFIESKKEFINGNPIGHLSEEDKFYLELKKCENAEQRKNFYFNYGKFLSEKNHIKVIGGKGRQLYIYLDGVYLLGEEKIRKEIRDTLREQSSAQVVKEILESVKDSNPIKREEFTVDARYINLKNGIYDIQTNEFFSHDPKFLFLTKIPVEYKSEAECSRIENFLAETVGEEEKNILYEWVGFCLYRDYFIKKAWIGVGEKNRGKSVWIRVLEKFFGQENTSVISLQKIASDKFATSGFYSKLINVYDDLSFNDIKDGGVFKVATGGGPISGEKKFMDHFYFTNYAKLTFTCNKIPIAKDINDDAYFTRWILTPFTKEIPPDKIDTRLTHKLTTDEEMSGLLNIALEKLKHLLVAQKFSYYKTDDEIREEMETSSSDVATFAYRCLEKSPESYIIKQEMYEKFLAYAHTNKMEVISMENFGRKIQRVTSYIGDGKPTIYIGDKAKQVKSWMGVKFKEDFLKTLRQEIEDKELEELRIASLLDFDKLEETSIQEQNLGI